MAVERLPDPNGTDYDSRPALVVVGDLTPPPSMLYRSLIARIQEKETRHTPKSFDQYLQEVSQRLEKARIAKGILKDNQNLSDEARVALEKNAAYTPTPHPGDIMFRAITSYPYDKNAAGQSRYTFFTGRGQRHMVYGNAYQLGLIVEFMADKTSRVPGLGKALSLIGSTGTGKTQVAEALKSGYEDYTRTYEQQYTITGCKYQCEPLLLLPKETHLSLEKEYGVVLEGEVCEHCQAKRQETISGGKSILNMELGPVEFSASLGVGIVTIQPEMTARFDQPQVRDLCLDRIRRANRGILEIPELFLHSPAFLKALMGIIRERRLSFRGIEYYPRFVVITHATRNDLRRFEALISEKKIEMDAAAFSERLTKIAIPYILSQSDEVALYKNALAQSGYNPHISPQTLELVSMVALASRLTGSKIPGVDIDKKVLIYDGKDTETITQKDRSKIEEEGRQNNEGLEGISAVLMVELLSHALKENPRCINPMQTLSVLERYIRMQPKDYPRKDELLKTIDNLEAKHDLWAEKVAKQTFRGDHENACQQEFNLYYDHVFAFVNMEKVYDPITREYVAPDEEFMREVEEALGVSETAKKQFREEFIRNAVFTDRKRDYAKNPVSYQELPIFKDGLEKKIAGVSETEVEEALLALLNSPPERRMMLEVADPKKTTLLQKAKQNMIERFEFCPDCAVQTFTRVARVIHDRTGKVVAAGARK